MNISDCRYFTKNNSAEGTRQSVRNKIPNYKHQAPNKHQIPMTKTKALSSMGI
jgi:hypothetical protein